jgi:poly(3-hydroxybutyrate) depolymerase
MTFAQWSRAGAAIASALLSLTPALHASASGRDQDLRETITFDGKPRGYRAFVPDAFGKSGPGPAVVLFNGSGSPVDSLMDEWKGVARKDGVMLIGPTAYERGAWLIPEDSPGFTSVVVEALKARFPVDPRRVYLVGHSGGAGHVLLLGLLESQYFAAVAAHASALRPSDMSLIDLARRKIPMGIWLGTKDDLVPLKAARDTLAALTAHGFPAKLTEMNGHTHSYAERGRAITEQAWAFLRTEALAEDPRLLRYPFQR